MLSASVTMDAIALIGLANSVASSFLTALGLVLQESASKRATALQQQQQQLQHHHHHQKGSGDGNASTAASEALAPKSLNAGVASSSTTAAAVVAVVPYEDPLYLIGLGCVLLGAVSSLVCDGLLPMSTLAPLTCQTIVYKCLLGRVVLGERLSSTAWLSLLLMCFGMAISVYGANLDDGSYTLDSLLDLFLQPSALAATLALGVVLWVLRRVLKRVYGDDFNNFLGLSYLVLAGGVVGGWSGVLVKALVELGVTAADKGSKDLFKIGTLIFVVLAPWLVTIKLKYVSQGLQHFSPDVFMPCYQAVLVACNAGCGIVYYTDFAGVYDPAFRHNGNNNSGSGGGGGGGHLLVYLCGLCLTMSGVLLMLNQRHNADLLYHHPLLPSSSSSSSSSSSLDNTHYQNQGRGGDTSGNKKDAAAAAAPSYYQPPSIIQQAHLSDATTACVIGASSSTAPTLPSSLPSCAAAAGGSCYGSAPQPSTATLVNTGRGGTLGGAFGHEGEEASGDGDDLEYGGGMDDEESALLLGMPGGIFGAEGGGDGGGGGGGATGGGKGEAAAMAVVGAAEFLASGLSGVGLARHTNTSANASANTGAVSGVATAGAGVVRVPVVTGSCSSSSSSAMLANSGGQRGSGRSSGTSIDNSKANSSGGRGPHRSVVLSRPPPIDEETGGSSSSSSSSNSSSGGVAAVESRSLVNPAAPRVERSTAEEGGSGPVSPATPQSASDGGWVRI